MIDADGLALALWISIFGLIAVLVAVFVEAIFGDKK